MRGARIKMQTWLRGLGMGMAASAAVLGCAAAGEEPSDSCSLQTAAQLGAALVRGPSVASEEVGFQLSDGSCTTGQFDYPLAGQPPFPAVLLLAGSGATDRDETVMAEDGSVDRPFVQISEELTQRGLAVFRFDKRGVCRPGRLCDADALAGQTLDSLSGDATAAYERMLDNPWIAPERTAVLGHSEGTWLAPFVAQSHPEVRALVLMGTGLGPMHVLQATQVTLPLLGASAYDANGDGALTFGELTANTGPQANRLLERLRPVGRLFLFRYGGTSPALQPVALNARLDLNADGALDLVKEIRLAYEAFLAKIDEPLSAVESYADPGVVPIAAALLASETSSRRLHAAYLGLPMDSNLRALLGATGRPRVFIANGENDDQTPASSAQLLHDALSAADYPAILKIYPGLSHGLSPQSDIFASYGFRIEPVPLADIGAFLEESLGTDVVGDLP
jgi:acetyl esterase/lipase